MYALPDKQKYPLDTKEQIEQAIDYFKKFEDRFSPTDRVTFAENLVKQASASGISVPPEIEMAVPTDIRPEWKELVMMRKNFLSPKDQEKLASLVEFNKRDLRKLAAELEKFDVETGGDRYWGSLIPDPWQSIFTHIKDVYAIKIAGEPIEMDKASKVLSKLANTKIFKDPYKSMLNVNEVGKLSEPAQYLVRKLING